MKLLLGVLLVSISLTACSSVEEPPAGNHTLDSTSCEIDNLPRKGQQIKLTKVNIRSSPRIDNHPSTSNIVRQANDELVTIEETWNGPANRADCNAYAKISKDDQVIGWVNLKAGLWEQGTTD